MALTGIEIFKLLPKTNCGACGIPTCLAFAMALAAGKTQLDKCPYVAPESRAKLVEASAPPIVPVTVGVGPNALKIGGETVMFRHEKRFENPPGLAITINDTMTASEVDERLKKVDFFIYERVGVTLKANLVVLKADSGDAKKFAGLAAKVKAAGDINIILMSENMEILAAGARACKESRPLLYAATKDNHQAVAALAKELNCPVAAKASGLDELADLTQKLNAAGINEIVIDPGSRGVRKALEDQVIIRAAALNKKFRALGYPTIVFASEMTKDPMQEPLIAAMFIAKYGGIIVLSDFKGESLFPLLVARLNLYTDPQRPLATRQGIYEINNPDENSPLMVTSNFSLTYFIVSGEIENSKVPSYLYVKDTEGLSVVTAWAAGKFTGDIIGQSILKSGIADKIKHRKLIIPGYIESEKTALEEELKGWEIRVGPKEAANLPAYLKSWRA